jgi:hypothetical protein
VKAYFFRLPAAERESILREYERQYGKAAREYADATIPKWASGHTKMSGTVAERLFNLLPPRMPLPDKYRLTETLWKHHGPSSKKVLRIGLDVSGEEVANAFLEHVSAVVKTFEIPWQLEARFRWLSAGDVAVKQQLLNHLTSAEVELAAEGIRAQTPVMLAHMRSESGSMTGRMAQVIKIGKHELEILVDRGTSGASIEDPRSAGYAPGTNGQSFNWGCLVWLLIVAVIVFALLQD